jgi:MFS transporter, Spinster family, sphingosine-1-phosphate transporter
VGGVVCGGIVTTKLGGYNTLASFRFIRFVVLCAVCIALPIPFLPNFYFVGSFFWLLLFCGGSILPSVTGIMISSVGDYQKAQANSVANACYNGLGYLPAPLIYGMISTFMKDPTSKVPMAVLLYSIIPTVSLAYYGIGRRIKETNQQQENDNREGTENS